MKRRAMLAGTTLLGAGAIGALGSGQVLDAAIAHDPLPLYAGPAATIHSDRRTAPAHRTVAVHWGVNTSKQLVALTFDDGPMPRWTPHVLDMLDDAGVPATFFMIGTHAAAHADLVRGRLGRHEVGNHTWAHGDLAKVDYSGARDAMARAHDTLAGLTGRDPVLLRPPYGHISGSTLLAAADLNYIVMLWNLQMLESEFTDRPAGLVDYIVTSATPGTVLLAHDAGSADRLVALRGLPAMIDGLRRRGFDFVTVSQLLAEA
jgi:peptidoglycan-N-acetylglucosamine deacetylase